MNRDTELSLIDRLLAHHRAGTTSLADDESRIPVEHYTSEGRFLDERDALFLRRPTIVGHVSELAAPGDYLTHDALGVPLLITRERPATAATSNGELRAFLNVCRHRGARVVLDERGSGKRSFVCGYHGWTYGLDGALLNLPHPEGFPRAGCDRGLVPVAVEARAGFIWVLPTPGVPLALDAFLGPLSAELEGFALADHVVHRAISVRRRFNWKLIIDAFLDGYHLAKLHRHSVARFFIDNLNLADAFPPHIRSSVARKGLEALAQGPGLPREQWRYRDVLSLTYFLFPNTVLIFHPDWVSRVTVSPVDAAETIFTHTMLVPREMHDAARLPHWEKTWALIHEGVFLREDLSAAEWIQGGLRSGANQAFTCGRYEYPIRLFHDFIEAALRESTQG